MLNDKVINMPISRLSGALQHAIAFANNPTSCPHCGSHVGPETKWSSSNEMVSTGLDGYRCESCPEEVVVPAGHIRSRHVSIHQNPVREW